MALKCGGCHKNIVGRQHLTCYFCKKTYDLDCSGVSIQRFLNTMTPERKNKWKCHACYRKTPKTDNTNTPTQQNSPPVEISSVDNITIRKKTNSNYQNNINISLSPENLSKLGDTLEMEGDCNQEKDKLLSPSSSTEPANLKQLESFLENYLDNKFDSIKKALLTDIKLAIISELRVEQQTIKTETNKKIELMKQEQEILKTTNENFDKRIKNLEQENEQLRHELQKIKQNNNKTYQLNSTNSPDIKSPEKNKQIVLYGVYQSGWESVQELNHNVVQIFQEILQLNLIGHIEDVKKMGKRGKRGPIIIELLSKNITKYILENQQYLNQAGITVSPFLDDEALTLRKELIEILIDARQKGHRSNIVNNKLYIDGKKYNHNLNKDINFNQVVNNTNCQSPPQELAYPISSEKYTSNRERTFFR